MIPSFLDKTRLKNSSTYDGFLQIVFKFNFFLKKSGLPSEYQTVWDPDQDRHFVGPDLGLNCLQRLLTRQCYPLVGITLGNELK